MEGFRTKVVQPDGTIIWEGHGTAFVHEVCTFDWATRRYPDAYVALVSERTGLVVYARHAGQGPGAERE